MRNLFGSHGNRSIETEGNVTGAHKLQSKPFTHVGSCSFLNFYPPTPPHPPLTTTTSFSASLLVIFSLPRSHSRSTVSDQHASKLMKNMTLAVKDDVNLGSCCAAMHKTWARSPRIWMWITEHTFKSMQYIHCKKFLLEILKLVNRTHFCVIYS